VCVAASHQLASNSLSLDFFASSIGQNRDRTVHKTDSNKRVTPQISLVA